MIGSYLTKSWSPQSNTQISLNSSVNWKGRETRDQIANIQWIIDKVREVQKKATFTLLTRPKTLTVWIAINCEKFFKRWEYQTTWPVSWEICRQVKKQQLELDMEQQTGSKQEKEYVKAVYCHLLI